MNLLVNASVARDGGALMITNDFVLSRVGDKNIDFCIAQDKPGIAPDNVIWISKDTRGISTFYSHYFSHIYDLRERALTKLVSNRAENLWLK